MRTMQRNRPLPSPQHEGNSSSCSVATKTVWWLPRRTSRKPSVWLKVSMRNKSISSGSFSLHFLLFLLTAASVTSILRPVSLNSRYLSKSQVKWLYRSYETRKVAMGNVCAKLTGKGRTWKGDRGNHLLRLQNAFQWDKAIHYGRGSQSMAAGPAA